jgi:hypothetical protein
MEMIKSKNDVPIRLTAERWLHIIENHDDLAGYYDDVINAIEEPNYIIKGYKEAFIALKEIEKGKFLAVVYKEISEEDGFIITAYFTSKIKIKLEKEAVVWRTK